MRKTRIDKKKDVKATLQLELKDAIYRLSYITFTPVKDVCAILCHNLTAERDTINKLSVYFQYDLIYDGSLFRGHHDNDQIEKRITGPTDRVTIRFNRSDYDTIYKIAYALNISPSRTAAVLLDMAMNDVNVINQFVKDYLQDHMSDYYMSELKYLLRYANRSNPNSETWASLLSSIVAEKGSRMLEIKEIVRDYLNDQ